MTTFLVIVIVYLLIALFTKPEDEEYWYEFWERLLWPITLCYAIWKCLTTEAHFKRNK